MGSKHVEGSVNIPLNHLQASERARAGSTMAVTRRSGRLSLVDRGEPARASRLERLPELAGGMAAWEAAQPPVRQAERPWREMIGVATGGVTG
jgi:hypothetical protein